jgi:hypothetical protein
MSQAPGYRPRSLTERVPAAVRARGLRPVAGDFLRWGLRVATGLPRTVRGEHGRFALGGESYPYLFHRHKQTWLSERAVEVPVVRRLVERHRGRRVLEVGNVLAHYGGPSEHVVVDKYERAPSVLNLDVSEVGDLGPFDLIVAISTLEHVGWDEEPRHPAAGPAAIDTLRAALAPEGRLMITVPAGYNPVFDRSLASGAAPLTRSAALRREPGTSRWHEVPVEEAWRVPYDFLLYSARAVVFAELPAEG